MLPGGPCNLHGLQQDMLSGLNLYCTDFLDLICTVQILHNLSERQVMELVIYSSR